MNAEGTRNSSSCCSPELVLECAIEGERERLQRLESLQVLHLRQRQTRLEKKRVEETSASLTDCRCEGRRARSLCNR
jgi:hypothetical protein